MKHAAINRCKSRGMATGAAMALCTLVMLTVMTMANLSITAMRLTQNGRDKAISLSLAEAGIDDAVDRIRLNNDYTGTGGAQSLHDADGNLIGTYSTTTVRVNDNLIDVYSTGKTTNEKPRQVRARAVISGLNIGDGAMIANGDIIVNGSINLKTDPLGLRNAHIRANGNTVVKGIGAYVDGRVSAVGTVTMNDGVSTDTLFPKGQNGAARIPFPSKKTVKEWENQWIVQAKSTGNIINGPVKTSMTITAPAYVNGNIDLQGSVVLKIEGTGVVYVDGSVLMNGNSKLINSTQLVIKNKFTQSSSALLGITQTPEYLADGAWSYTPPVMIALSNDPIEAVYLTGSAANNQYSMIYAANGGIYVDGSSEIRGALVAGGEGAQIYSEGSYVHKYPDKAVMASKIANSPTVISWIEM
jgi:hypothetical protein